MAYKVKDLMINLAAGRIRGGGGTWQTYSAECGTTPTRYIAGTATSLCGVSGIACGEDPVVVSQQLAILKAQLKQALAEVENEERIVNEVLEPKTVAQVEELQNELRKALKDLDSRKAKLEKQKKPQRTKRVAPRRRRT